MTRKASLSKSVSTTFVTHCSFHQRRSRKCAYDATTNDPVKTRLLEAEAEEQPITTHGIKHCDWFVPSLLLPNPTIH